MSILVIAAHPDDEVLGCGGTMARLSSKGEDIQVLILAEGLTSRIGFDRDRERAALMLHHQRAEQAGALLGATRVKVVGYPDQKMDTVPLLDITHTIEQMIDEVKPHTIYTHHGGDLNIDHVITFRATMTATRPTAGHPVKKIFTYEIPSSSDWSFQQFHPFFQPNTFVDITSHIDLKLKAMSIYESEAREFPHPRAYMSLRAISARWGSVAGLPAAEAFQLIREIQ